MLSLEQSAPEVYQECVGAFNQVHIDQATEWVNKLCRLSNGIIGITKTDRQCARSLVLVSLPQVWAQFISLSENTADLAAFLSEYLVKRFPNVPAGCELVLGGALSAQNFIIQPRKGSCIDF